MSVYQLIAEKGLIWPVHISTVASIRSFVTLLCLPPTHTVINKSDFEEAYSTLLEKPKSRIHNLSSEEIKKGETASLITQT
jgi:hypothetical protein